MYIISLGASETQLATQLKESCPNSLSEQADVHGVFENCYSDGSSGLVWANEQSFSSDRVFFVISGRTNSSAVPGPSYPGTVRAIAPRGEWDLRANAF
jgi:hypothetical protein